MHSPKITPTNHALCRAFLCGAAPAHVPAYRLSGIALPYPQHTTTPLLLDISTAAADPLGFSYSTTRHWTYRNKRPSVHWPPPVMINTAPRCFYLSSFHLRRTSVLAFFFKGGCETMYPIKDYPSPITRELVHLAAEYGQSLEFAKDPKIRGDAHRFVRFRFTNRAEMRAFERFVLDHDFQAKLQVAEDDGHNVYTIMCSAAVD